MSTIVQPITAEQLLMMPDNHMRRELIAGEVREMTPAGSEHGRVAMKLGGRLEVFVEQQGLGVVYAAETGFILARDPDTVRAPDVAFVSREREAQFPSGSGYFPGPPDLAMEVISPSDRYADVESKAEEWLASGCRMVIVANPRNRTLKVYRSISDVSVLTLEDTFDGGDVVPGFRISVRSVFPD